MLKSDLNFSYPSELIATEKKPLSRVMKVIAGQPEETRVSSLISQIEPVDIFIINNTKVIPARVHSQEGLEVLFIKSLENNQWQVLCPVRKWPKGKDLQLPGGVSLKLIERGRPQQVQSSRPIDYNYFLEFGEMPLPPYIQQARDERKARELDKEMYQTDWAKEVGSLAAPTASLHFSAHDLEKIKNRGAEVGELCLHVGLGTFLPITTENLDDHKMHSEFVSIPKKTWDKVLECKKQGGKVWALGSTVTRSLESLKMGLLHEGETDFYGETNLFIKPGFDYQIVDVLMTNFHQPESTLIAMVMAFAGIENVKHCYEWAIERKFQLFSYGDLSVWTK